MTSAYRAKPLLTEGINSESELVTEFGPECPDFDAGGVCCKAHLEWALRNTKNWLEGI